MKSKYVLVLAAILTTGFASATSFATDTFKTRNNKEVVITFIRHGSLMLTFNNQSIQVDPVSQFADYATFSKADVILITHEHGDHLDSKAIERLTTQKTLLVTNEAVKKKLDKGVAMKNGDKMEISDELTIEAVPAYNTTSGREMYHPRTRDNGYVLTLDGLQIYIAGDTEDIPELKDLKQIDIAFIPVNQPYTMSVSQAVHAAKVIAPKVLYPYHFGKTDVQMLKEELKDSGIDVRIRNME